jgi:hypothetical protein
MATKTSTAIVRSQKERVLALMQDIQDVYPSLFPTANLTEAEAYALAMVGEMQGLDPLNKEIYYLKKTDRDGVTTAIGVMPGIRGLRKHARNQIRFEGGRSANYWIDFERILDQPTKDILGAGEQDLVIVARMRDSVTMRQYLEMRQLVFGNDRSWTDLLKLAREDAADMNKIREAIEDNAAAILGKPPVTIGVGIVKSSEYAWDNGKIARPLKLKSGQSAAYMCDIRAERRAIYKRFDLVKIYGKFENTDAEDLIEEADYADVDAQEEEPAPEGGAQPEPEATRTEADILDELGYGKK